MAGNLTVINSLTGTITVANSSISNFMMKNTISSVTIDFEGEIITITNTLVNNTHVITVSAASVDVSSFSNYGDSFTVTINGKDIQIILYSDNNTFKITDGTWECGRYKVEPPIFE